MISSPLSEQIDAGFLWIEIELGCTLLHTAQSSSDPEQIRKCHEMAMTAYATVQRNLDTVVLKN